MMVSKQIHLSQKIFIPVLTILLTMLIPLNNDKVFAVTDTPTTTLAVTPSAMPTITCTSILNLLTCTQVDPYTVNITKSNSNMGASGEVAAPVNTPIYLKLIGQLVYDNNVNYVSGRWTPPFYKTMGINVNGVSYTPASYQALTYSSPNVFTRTIGTYNLETVITKATTGNLKFNLYASCIVACNYQAMLGFGQYPRLTFQLSTLPPTPTPTLTPSPTLTPTPTATLTPTVTPIPTNTPALYLTPYYIGSGYFPSNNLKYCHNGGYFAQVQGAANRWSADTDLNLSYDCASRDIATIYEDFGDAGFVGYAYICDINDQCDGSPIDTTYKSCGLWLNKWVISNDPTLYTDAEVEKVAMHEFGHCFSLDHSSDPTSITGGGSVPNAWDIYWINLRY